MCVSKLVKGAAILLLAGALNTGCSASHQTGTGAASSSSGGQASVPTLTPEQFAKLQADALGVLTRRCASCHSAAGTGPGQFDVLNIEVLKSSRRVIAGRPQDSKLYLDVVDGLEPRDINLVKSAPRDVTTLRDWIYYLR